MKRIHNSRLLPIGRVKMWDGLLTETQICVYLLFRVGVATLQTGNQLVKIQHKNKTIS